MNWTTTPRLELSFKTWDRVCDVELTSCMREAKSRSLEIQIKHIVPTSVLPGPPLHPGLRDRHLVDCSWGHCDVTLCLIIFQRWFNGLTICKRKTREELPPYLRNDIRHIWNIEVLPGSNKRNCWWAEEVSIKSSSLLTRYFTKCSALVLVYSLWFNGPVCMLSFRGPSVWTEN